MADFFFTDKVVCIARRSILFSIMDEALCNKSLIILPSSIMAGDKTHSVGSLTLGQFFAKSDHLFSITPLTATSLMNETINGLTRLARCWRTHREFVPAPHQTFIWGRMTTIAVVEGYEDEQEQRHGFRIHYFSNNSRIESSPCASTWGEISLFLKYHCSWNITVLEMSCSLSWNQVKSLLKVK